MKKFLALTLSLLMVFSCMTCMFTSPVSAAEATEITWQSADPKNSMTSQTDVVYDDGPAWIASSAYRAYYTRLNLAPNTNYTFTMYTKNLDWNGVTNNGNNYNQFSIVSSLGNDEADFAKVAKITENGNTYWTAYKLQNNEMLADGADKLYNAYPHNVGAQAVEDWYKVTVNFTTTNATQYLVVMSSLVPIDGSQKIYVSDMSFEKKILGEWKSGRAPKVVTTESDGSAVVPFDNGPAYRIHTWPCNQSIYTTAKLEANTTYNFTAYFKGYYIPTVVYGGGGTATDGKGDTWVVSTKAGFDDCRDSAGSVSIDGTWLAFDDNDGYENLYKQDAYRDAYTDLNTWRKYSFNFTTTTDTEYYIILGIEQTTNENGNVDFYMSDVSVKKVIGMSATAEGNGTVTVSNSNPDAGEEVTFTATATNGSNFLGWYNGDTKVSDNLVYIVTADKALTLTAKFEGGVTLENWKSPASWVSVTQNSVASAAVSGPVTEIKSPASQLAYTRVTLEPSTTYTLTMYTKNLDWNRYGRFSIVTSFDDDAIDFGKCTKEGTNWRDYNENHIADGATVMWQGNRLNSGYTTVTGADGAQWQKVTKTFTTTATDTRYMIVIANLDLIDSSNAYIWISDMSIAKQVSLSATAEGNGTATVDKASASSGETVTFTATTAGGSTFLGWYNGSELVSDQLVYTVIAKNSLNLVAKFKGGATAVDGWVCPRDTNGWIKTTTDIAPKAGGTVYTTGSWPCDRSIYTKITLKPGTTYTFSAYFMGAVAAAIRNNADPNLPTLYQDGKGDETWIISANADITKGNYVNGSTVTATSSWNEFTGNGNYANLNKGDGSIDAWDADNKFTTWRKYEVTFTTAEDTEYYIILGLEGDSSKQTGQANGYPTYMSDASIIEVGDSAPQVTDFTSNLGSSLRKESESAYGQAIRHKFTLDKEVFTTNYDGYKLVEFGFATAVTANLENHADIPVLNANSYKVLTGVAYKADYNGNVSRNVVFAEDDTTVTYTAALFNIVDYAKSYTVAPYVIFENEDGKKVTRYGEGQTASIFDVAKAILNGSNTDDKAYVNNTLLAGDYKAQYDAWLAK